jgi:phosphatidate cytidylyltransferase
MEAKKFHNLLPRILTAVIFIPTFIYITKKGGIAFFIIIECIAFLGLVEFYRIANHKGAHPLYPIGIAGTFAIGTFAYLESWEYLFVTLMVLVAVTMIWQIARKENTTIISVSSTITGTFFIGGFSAFILLLREMPRHIGFGGYHIGYQFILTLFLVTWFCDTGAYGFGSWLGRKKLIPRISPGKSVEGFMGGIAMALLGGILSRVLFAPYLTVTDSICIGLGSGLVGQAGDLVESLYKRDARVKDSSSIIPGHGGILDIFDSVLFNAPFLYIYLKYVKF